MLGNAWEWTDTVPARWSEPAEAPERRIFVMHWFPALLPNLDTQVQRRRVELESASRRRPLPSDYIGEGRIVVGGGFRNRYIANLALDRARDPVVYETLQRDIVSVQLLAPKEWRDDLGFRCVKSIGAAEVRALAARPDAAAVLPALERALLKRVEQDRRPTSLQAERSKKRFAEDTVDGAFADGALLLGAMKARATYTFAVVPPDELRHDALARIRRNSAE